MGRERHTNEHSPPSACPAPGPGAPRPARSVAGRDPGEIQNPAGADVIVDRRPLVKGELPLVAWRFSECDPAASQGRATQAREQRVSTVRETRRHAGFGQVNGDELAVGQREQIGLIEIGLGGRVLDQHERRKFVWAQHGYLLKGAAPALADINDLQMPLQPANMFGRF